MAPAVKWPQATPRRKESSDVVSMFEPATLAKIDFANFDSANVYDIADSSDVWPQFS